MTLAETWPWWLGGLLFLLWFAWFEWWAFAHPSRSWTLSRTVAFVGARWPFSIVLVALTVGSLLTHFYWPWAANPLGPGGG
ncbi:MAG TPA: hypothetical protein VN325_23270 [Steroidobacteraceae bacterium]|nr:hypothetical protein [Steroidobacteraceae bacterium]